MGPNRNCPNQGHSSESKTKVKGHQGVKAASGPKHSELVMVAGCKGGQGSTAGMVTTKRLRLLRGQDCRRPKATRDAAPG